MLEGRRTTHLSFMIHFGPQSSLSPLVPSTRPFHAMTAAHSPKPRAKLKRVETICDEKAAREGSAAEVVVFGAVYIATPTDPQMFKAAASDCETKSWIPGLSKYLY